MSAHLSGTPVGEQDQRLPELFRKGLKPGVLGFFSNLMIGLSSAAPAYSIAATFGGIVAIAGVGLAAPSVLIVSFLPMICVACGYYYLNRFDPDCGTTFAWVTRAMGPQLGWVAGWAVVAANFIVLSALAQIAGTYTFLLVGWQNAASSAAAVTSVGVAWIVVMTLVCLRRVQLSARTQKVLSGAEIAILIIFAVTALFKVYTNHASGQVLPSWQWLNPFHIASGGAFAAAALFGIFMYWGWDTAVSVNEESKNASRGPGRAAVISTLVLVGLYVVTSVAAQAFGGPQLLAQNSNDVLSVLGARVFGSPLDKLLVLAVLTSTSACTMTTILPCARTGLSMAYWRCIPERFATVHRRFGTPVVATVVVGGAGAVWYVVISQLSKNVLVDSATGTAFLVAFYYGFTALACPILYRRELTRSLRTLVMVGVIPMLGFVALMAIFVLALHNYSQPGAGVSAPVFGVQVPVLIGIGTLMVGVVLMLVAWASSYRDFFSRRPEVVPRGFLEPPTPLAGAAAPQLSVD